MIDPSRLVADLKQQVLALEDDLRERIELPQFAEVWKREHHRAVEKNRTAATYTAWADDRITQAAVSWALTTAFLRFCEDNRLLTPVWISGPPERRQEAMDAQLVYFRTHPEHTDREWVDQAIYHLARTPATARLVDDQAMLHTVSPSGQAVTRLLEFWRRTDDSGRLVHDFTDADLDTRFLGDLYQDLSDHAKKTFALLQTPEFVEEFILDRTLTPALADRPLEGFKLIDPACGSGHFLLGAFQRLLSKWDAEAPGLGPRERVQKALDAVWGVDVNAFAVAIAQFRLLVAALQATGETSLEKAPDFRINVLVGDSLWFSHDQAPLPGTLDDDFAYTHEQRSALHQVLTRGQYDAVVANPPYITVKDKALNTAYRDRFSCLKGKYQLTAPFMELLFKLAKHGDGETAGWVGQITSNAFMKREFGTPLVEDLLAHLDLRLVVDTSGAYVPGHGTPTVIIVGRNQSPATGTIRTVLGVRGEPGRPGDPAHGLVWSEIVTNIDRPGTNTSFINVVDLERTSLAHHPWSLSGGGATEATATIERSRGSSLGTWVRRIGFFGVRGSDDAMELATGGAERAGLEADQVAPLVLGDVVRDFRVLATEPSWFPYTTEHSLKPLDASPGWSRWLWRLRTELGSRATFSKRTYFAEGRPFYEWHQLPPDHDAHPWVITFAFVATHNHFVLDRGGKVFNRSAPVIKLPAEASEDDHLKLLGVLNSSPRAFG